MTEIVPLPKAPALPQAQARRFLFLQGPHGPFFATLARQLRAAGAGCWRVGFNQGDRAFWPDQGYIPFRQTLEDWPKALATIMDDHAITDLVLYGDTRPIHASAIAQARAHDITIHVFEEGYLRPYWITYERGGSNGNSPLMALQTATITRLMEGHDGPIPDAPATWGNLWHHVFYGALYHFCVLALNRGYRHFRPHRAIGVAAELRLYLRRILRAPLILMHRRWATGRLLRAGHPFHLVLMQLAHDASFRDHGPFASQAEFLDEVMRGFALGAPRHHHLAIKAHPLEDGRHPLRRIITAKSVEYGLKGRVHYIEGGKLARLLDATKSVLTVNSTAAQQALWRGLPVKAYGRAIYDKPEFVSPQSTMAFFAAPQSPDLTAYLAFRRFLLLSSQLRGSFYSAKGRRQVLRVVADHMLANDDAYGRLLAPSNDPKAHRSKPVALKH